MEEIRQKIKDKTKEHFELTKTVFYENEQDFYDDLMKTYHHQSEALMLEIVARIVDNENLKGYETEILDEFKTLRGLYLQQCEKLFEKQKQKLEQLKNKWLENKNISIEIKKFHGSNEEFVCKKDKTVSSFCLHVLYPLPTGYGNGVRSIAETFDFEKIIKEIEEVIYD